MYNCFGPIKITENKVFIFYMLQEAFDILNFTGEEKFNIYKLCSGITHMGDMKFKQRGEQAEEDDSNDGSMHLFLQFNQL